MNNNRVYLMWYADRDVEGDRCVIDVVSRLEGVASVIEAEAARREVTVGDVDGTDVPGFVTLSDGSVIWVSSWDIDGGPNEVTRDELNDLARLLGLE